MSRRKQTLPCKVRETPSARFSEANFLEESKNHQENIEVANSAQKCPLLNEVSSDQRYWNAMASIMSKQNGEISTRTYEDGEPLNLSKTKHDESLTSDKHLEDEEKDQEMLIDEEKELKCSISNLDFTSQSDQKSHRKDQSENIEMSENDSPCSSPVFRKFKLFSGFHDLSFVDFSCNKFSVISEDVCSKVFHRLTDRDSKHFFLCKACDRLFPTLSSLECHLKKHKQTSKISLPSSEEGNKSLKDKLNDEEFTFNKSAVTQFLGLKAVEECSETAEKNILTYAMDNPEVKTSPDLSSVNVPSWMKVSISDDCFYDTEISRESSDVRPPLKLKLVRRRTTGEEGKPILIPSQYFIEDECDDLPNGWDQTESGSGRGGKENASKFDCNSCGDSFLTLNALSGHRASSVCGIGVGSSSNGRRMYWCRLCNYVSCEKSTILRHQRTHTGLRPYSCKFCEIAFTTKANCERHIRKRHRLRVSNDVDVKKSVFCDYDLLRKARDGEINVPPTATISNPGGRYFSFICRICKAAFSSRSNGARHVMAKHSIMNRKKANEAIVCDRAPVAQNRDSASPPQDRGSQGMDGRSERNVIADISRKHNMANPTQNRDPSSLKVPQLIPLAKIRAHYKASMRLAEKFNNEYDQVFQAIQRMQEDGGSLSSKLLSLIGSASALLKQKRSSSSFTPVSFFDRSPSFAPNPANGADDLNDQIQPASEYGRYEEADAFFNNDQSLYDDDDDDDDDDEMGNFTSKTPFINGDFSTSSSPSHSPFPWKSSSSLLLRHFAAKSNDKELDDDPMRDDVESEHDRAVKDGGADLASVGELMDFLKAPSLLGLRNGPFLFHPHGSSISRTCHLDSSGSKLGHGATASPDKPFSLGSRFGSSFSPFGKSRFSWPDPPTRLRDERGRYIRNPNSPKLKTPKLKPISSLLPYRGHSDLPTMVPLRDGKVNLEGLKSVMSKKGTSLSCGISVKGRKCPKCDKVFPWASSLSRHIMTHTGLKPYMCAKCSMRFTTRSNLLRHAYRRHNVVRGSNERHNVLLTLPLSEQKKHAEREAQRMAEIGDLEARRIAEAEEEQLAEDDEVDHERLSSNKDLDKLDAPSTEVNEEEANHYNKRYMCGLCKLPFANRSNLVRHLHRLHQITKDDPEFRGLLIKLHSKPMKFKFNNHPRAFHPIKPASVRQKIDQPELEDGNSPSSISPSPSLLNGFGKLEVNVGKPKPFTCSICFIGFTKRNNAARHMQHQHNISRKSATFHQLIIRNDVPLADTPEVKKEESIIEEKPAFVSDEDPKNTVVVEVAQDSFQEADPPTGEDANMEPKPAVEKDSTLLSETTEETVEVKGTSPVKNRRRSMTWRKMEEDTGEDLGEHVAPIRQHKKKDIRLTHFICGVCKRIFKEVADLKVHLEEHNIPHPWHCSVCGVPFTNKYNCQRHLMRRHGISDLEPKYVEDLRHGPPQPRRRSKGLGRGKSSYNKAKAGAK